MAYGDFKDLARRTAADKVLRDKAFKIASDPKYDGYQRRVASMVYECFDKKSSGSGITNNEIKQNMNFINQLLENSKKEKCIFHLDIIFWVLI